MAFSLGLLLSVVQQAFAQDVPAPAEGLEEELIELALDQGMQAGVLSRKAGQAPGTRLIVLLPGYPSVVRPEMGHGVMSKSRLGGNFLVRARRHLNNGNVMTLLVDCHTALGDTCSPDYQASENRHRHVKALVDAARAKVPSIREVYLMSTSMGSISSAFVGLHGGADWSGVIHTASIDPTAPRSYRQLSNFDYSQIRAPQVFIHHADDPCAITSYGYIRSVAEKYGVPLVTVTGGSNFRGQPCQAFTQHGFVGQELAVMREVLRLVQGGVWASSTLR